MNDDLPELPAPVSHGHDAEELAPIYFYTADQMHAYARAAVEKNATWHMDRLQKIAAIAIDARTERDDARRDADRLRAEVEALRAKNARWLALYRRAINEANGLTNYVEDRPELRGAERRLAKIEEDARDMIDAARAEAKEDHA